MDITPPQWPTRPPERRFQFGLWFLFSLVTISAICCVLIRSVGELAVRPWFRYVAYAYLLAMTTYIALRVPFVIRRVARGRRAVAARRRTLSSWTDELRSRRQRKQADSD